MKKCRTANMQYKKLGFCGLVRVFGSQKVQCTVTENRSEDPQLFILPHVSGHCKKKKMELTDKIWKDLHGGYKVPYDASIPLRQLEETNNPITIKELFEELWDELHHQGDVGLASYLALPQLVRICKAKGLFDWNLLGLCCVIEQQRHLGDNPILPIEFRDYYTQGLKDLKQYVINNLNKDSDKITTTFSLSAIATFSGQTKLGKAIMELEDDDIINEFLEQF